MRYANRLSHWLLGLFLACTGLLGFNYYSLDGLLGLYVATFLGEDTYYAEGYSSSAFRRVQIGMTNQQVLELLGEPLDRFPLEGGEEGWLYSWKRSDTNYRVRVIHFYEGSVTRIIAEMFVD